MEKLNAKFLKLSAGQIEKQVELLDKLKTGFDNESTNAKITILRKLSSAEIIDAETLESYHDILCFVRAYPDSRLVMNIAENELQNFGERIKHYTKNSKDRQAKKLLDSGIVGTVVSYEFSYELTVSLSEWFENLVEIDWNRYEKNETNSITAILPLLVAWQENDTLENDLTIPTSEWLNYGRSKKDHTDLQVLLKILRSSGLSRAVQRHLFESAEIPVKWALKDCKASRTLQGIPFKKIFFQKKPLISRTKDLRTELKKTPVPLKLLTPAQGKNQVRNIKEVLGVRCRELFPLINSNPTEVYINEPDRGVMLVILGNNPDIRLPLESNFGAMLVRNGIPIGYGIGCMLFERVEIAINIFPAFRTGESSFIIEQFFRLFYHHFGAKLLLVRSYQVGDDNEEALESGSFWFYYKLGFRSVNKRVRQLADTEYEKIQADRSYRCSMNILKRLAKGDIFFHIDSNKMNDYKELPLKNLGYIVTKYIADKFDGDRQLAIKKSVSQVARILNIQNWKSWSDDEITGFERLAPIIANIPDLHAWTKNEKAAMARIIRAKGTVRERDFVRLTQKHNKFKEAIDKMAFGWEGGSD